jgi:hypothetical protein
LAFGFRSASSAAAIALVFTWAGVASAQWHTKSWAPLDAIYPEGWMAAASSGDSTGPPPVVSTESEASEAASKQGSGKKALLYSLLLPGTGELYLGHSGRATGFFVAEGLIWTNYIYWTVAGNMRQDNYVQQAQLNAGVGVSSASDSYWSNVGQYISSSGDGPDTYEEQLRIQARDQYPDDPAAQDAYVAENLPKGDEAWSWTSVALQDNYVSTRQSAQQADDNAKYSFGAAILNRILSVIDVQLLRHKAAKSAESLGQDAPTYRLGATVGSDGEKQLVLQRRF